MGRPNEMSFGDIGNVWKNIRYENNQQQQAVGPVPSATASLTDLPVIGVPFAVGPLNGLDALLATVQVPPGVPVATVGIDNAKNAAQLAIRILKV